jgi:hypothetical protein
MSTTVPCFRLSSVVIDFKEQPESIYFANKYVSLLKREHSAYWLVEKQEGAVAIINGDTFSLEKRLEINLDPFDLVVDSKGYIYEQAVPGNIPN